MKDELEELTTDASSRKTATDWLMKVISARKPINLHLNGMAEDEDGEGAIAVTELVDEPVAREWASQFSAEDLCGAPAVPVIKVIATAASEVTADDVCWVPEDRRLKPQPPVEPASRVLQMATPARDSQRDSETRQPEVRKAPTSPIADGFFAPTALATDPARAHGSMDNHVLLSDISREPAPYVVAPMPNWGAFSDNFHASEVVDRPITEADISRDWVIQSVEPVEEKGKDGVVLPFSFKVLKSREAALVENASTAPAPPETTSASIAEGSQVEAVVFSPEVNGTAIADRAEVPALSAVEAAEVAAYLDSIAAAPEVIAEEAPVAVAPSESVMQVVEAPEPQVAVEVEPPTASAPEPQQSLEPVEVEAHTSAVKDEEPELEAATREKAAAEEIASGSSSTHQAESVFSREGFWEGSVPGQVAASEQASLNMDLKASYPPPEGEELDGSGKPPEEWVSAWKALLRIGSVLPWVAKSLPAVEAGAAGESAGAPAEVRQDVAGLRLVQYEIRTTVQDHTLQLKRMDEQLGRIRESLESKSSSSDDLVENVESMSRLVRIVGAGLGGLVLVLILLVGILLAHGR